MWVVTCLREHIPLQQGLRLTRRANCCIHSILREHIPLQQGLRHIALIGMVKLLWVSESIFHYNKDWDHPHPHRMHRKHPSLREHIPLQQGLRLGSPFVAICPFAPRAYSITTRIETRMGITAIILALFCSESIFHYNKDWDFGSA